MSLGEVFHATGGFLSLLSRAFMLPWDLWGDDYGGADFLLEHDKIARWFSGEVQGADRLTELWRFLFATCGPGAPRPRVLELGAAKVGVWTNVVRLAAARRGWCGARYVMTDLEVPKDCRDLVDAGFEGAACPGDPLAVLAVDHTALVEGGLAALFGRRAAPGTAAQLAGDSFDLIVGSHLFCVCDNRICQERTCGGVPQAAGGVSGFLEAVLHLLRPGGCCVLAHMAPQVPDTLRGEISRWAEGHGGKVQFDEIKTSVAEQLQMAMEFRDIRSNGTAHLRERFIYMVLLEAHPSAFVFRREPW